METRLEVSAALRGALAAPAAAAEQPAKDVAEVAHVSGLEAVGIEAAPSAGEASSHRAHATNLVVFLALLVIAEHVIGRRDVLEAILATGVGIGMEFLSQLAVGPRDLLVRGGLRHAEDLVVVLLEPLALGRHGALSP